MLRLVTTLLTALIAVGLSAQLVFIPDTLVRDELNSQAPGCVDVSGFLDLSYPGVAELQGVYISNAPALDITGLEQLPDLRVLNISMLDGGLLTVPEWPATLSRLSVMRAGNTTLPDMPAGLDNLLIAEMASLQQVPVLPAGLLGLDLTALPTVTDLPALPTGLNFLRLSTLDLQSIPVLPNTVDTLWLTAFPNVSSLPPMPDELRFLDIEEFPLLAQVPDISDGLVKAWLRYSPLTSIPAMGNSVEELELRGLDQLVTVDQFPGGPLRCVIVSCPALTTIAPLQPGAIELTLSDCALIDDLPLLPASLETFWCIYTNSLTAMPNMPPGLKQLSVQIGAQFASLPPLANTIREIRFTQTPLLTQISDLPDSLLSLTLENTGVPCLPALPNGLNSVSVTGSPISCIPNVPDSLEGINPSSLIDEICDLTATPCPDGYPNARGIAYHDLDQDGIRDAGEPGLFNCIIVTAPGGFMTGTDVDGRFDVSLPIDDHTLSCIPYSPYVQSITPVSHSAPLLEPNDVDSLNDFAVVLIPGVQDLRVLLTSTPARPGFNNTVRLSATNVGTVEQDAAIELVIDPNQAYLGAEPTPTSISGDTVRWSPVNMPLGVIELFDVYVSTPVSVPLGTMLSIPAMIGPLAGDSIPADNHTTLRDDVVGSYDPNDKLVTPSVLTPEEATQGTRVVYTIRFQNTGSFLAERVLLIDALPAGLDVPTFHFESSSHACTWSVIDNELQVLFENIMLPHDDADEPGSHGYFSFSIEPMNDLLDGESVVNIANIYFDFNAPIVTDPSVLSIDVTAAVPELSATTLLVQPNPADDVIRISTTDLAVILGARITTLDGREVLTVNEPAGSTLLIPVSPLASGVYLLHLVTGHGTRIARIVRR